MKPVDVADQLGKLLLKMTIGFDAAARQRRNLQQRYRPAERRMQGQHLIERLDAIDQTLGIIDAVNADGELFAMQAAAQARYVGMRHRLDGVRGELVNVDADGERSEARDSVA